MAIFCLIIFSLSATGLIRFIIDAEDDNFPESLKMYLYYVLLCGPIVWVVGMCKLIYDYIGTLTKFNEDI